MQTERILTRCCFVLFTGKARQGRHSREEHTHQLKSVYSSLTFSTEGLGAKKKLYVVSQALAVLDFTAQRRQPCFCEEKLHFEGEKH